MSNEMEKDTIVLEFEDAEAVECDVLGIFEEGGKEYIALVAVDTEENEDEESEVFIYRYKEVGDDEFEMEDIEDDAEFEAAVKKLEDLYEA